ncbi:hypothetical protein COT69_00785, partial [candidate division WWE3 bacterium CG09_land_8_20_14_0_10_39_24]
MPVPARKASKSNSFFTVSSAAKELGISASTLRRLEEEQKVSSSRNKKNARIYSKEDVFKLKEEFSKEKEIKEKIKIKKRAKRAGMVPQAYNPIFIPTSATLRIRPKAVYASALSKTRWVVIGTFLTVSVLAGFGAFVLRNKTAKTTFIKQAETVKVAGESAIKSEGATDGSFWIGAIELTTAEPTSKNPSGKTILDILADSTFWQDIEARKKLTLEDLFVKNNAAIDNSLKVKNDIIAGNDITARGGLTVDENTIIGYNSTKTVAINAKVSSDILPYSTATYDLGTSALRWNNVMGSSGDFSGTMTIGGNTSIGGGLTVSGAVTSTGQVLLSDGTFSAPGLAFASDTDTGLYRISADKIGLITGGVATQGVTINSSGNVGIGDVAPGTKLSVVGNAQIGYASGTTGPANGLAISGNVGIGEVSPGARLDVEGADSLNTTLAGHIRGATGTGLVITNAGNVGIGTTSPLAKLHVAGECVVGNTLLPVKRRKKKTRRRQGYGGQGNGDGDDDGWEDLLVPIKDIREGDLVASLDEQSGEIVYRPIKKLLNKGFQKVVKITTSDGRSIETTLNHPYLTQVESQKSKVKSKWLKVSELKAGMKIAVPETRSRKTVYAFIDASNLMYAASRVGWKMDYEKLASYLRYRFGVSRLLFYGGVDHTNKKQLGFYKKLKEFGYELNLIDIKKFSDGSRKADVDSRLTIDAAKLINNYNEALFITGDGDYFWLFEYLMQTKKIKLLSFEHNTAKELKKLFGAEFADLDRLEEKLSFTNKKATDAIVGSAAGIMSPSYQSSPDLSRDKVKFVEIAVIEETGRKEVFDIEVEGTHNFVGNDIVAHNTYIKGADQLNTSFSLRTADSTGADKFVVTNAGNVGIGTTNPSYALNVAGSANLTTGNAYYINGA